jgi:hypothetical protein
MCFCILLAHRIAYRVLVTERLELRIRKIGPNIHVCEHSRVNRKVLNGARLRGDMARRLRDWQNAGVGDRLHEPLLVGSLVAEASS